MNVGYLPVESLTFLDEDIDMEVDGLGYADGWGVFDLGVEEEGGGVE